LREWNIKTGHSAYFAKPKAEFVDFQDTEIVNGHITATKVRIVLKRPDGKTVTYLLDEFSDKDKQFISDVMSQRKAEHTRQFFQVWKEYAISEDDPNFPRYLVESTAAAASYPVLPDAATAPDYLTPVPSQPSVWIQRRALMHINFMKMRWIDETLVPEHIRRKERCLGREGAPPGVGESVEWVYFPDYPFPGGVEVLSEVLRLTVYGTGGLQLVQSPTTEKWIRLRDIVRLNLEAAGVPLTLP
jgi:hypothetical protein